LVPGLVLRIRVSVNIAVPPMGTPTVPAKLVEPRRYKVLAVFEGRLFWRKLPTRNSTRFLFGCYQINMVRIGKNKRF
jgi:hypothetical protein